MLKFLFIVGAGSGMGHTVCEFSVIGMSLSEVTFVVKRKYKRYIFPQVWMSMSKVFVVTKKYE